MFLRRHRRKKKGESYEYWTLVETVRTARGPRQRIVANLGKLPGLDDEEKWGWQHIGELLADKADTSEAIQIDWLEDHAVKEPPQWAHVNLAGIRVENLRKFGQPYMALALWHRLHLHRFFREHMNTTAAVPSDILAFILSCGRFCEQSSELALAERWYGTTALEDLTGVRVEEVYDNRLYRGLDALLPLKEKLFTHLRKRYESLFGARFEFLLYDITSTYFEGQCQRNAQAKHGYSRDNRPDCKQVCIGLVVSESGLPLAYEVFDGNRADVTTVEEMVELMERHYGAADRIWVMDRGMVSEENLDYLRSKNARYIVGTPKSDLRKLERSLLNEGQWREVQAGVEVQLVQHPDLQDDEQYVLCRSEGRRQKERAMLEKQMQRLGKKLREIDAGLRKRPQDMHKAGMRIGRWFGRNTLAEKMFEVDILKNENGKACGLNIIEKADRTQWASLANGAYLLRTNVADKDPQSLWKWYVQLTQVEDAFRCSKSDLRLRPVFHHREDRVQAHIMVCFLSLVMRRMLEAWCRAKGLGDCARQLLYELENVRSMDVVVPVKTATTIRLRLVAKPDKLCSQLLQKLDLKLPNTPKIIENVVQTF